MSINGKEYMTTAEAAEQLGLTQGRIRQLVKDGTITDRIVIANRTFIEVGEITRYASERKAAGRPPQN